VLDACWKRRITEHTYDRWKKDYGGLRVAHATRLKGLEQKNLRLKRIVADHALDLSILKAVALGNFSARPAGLKPWDTPSRCSRCPSVERVGRSTGSGPPLGTCRVLITSERGCASGSSPSRRSMGGTATVR